MAAISGPLLNKDALRFTASNFHRQRMSFHSANSKRKSRSFSPDPPILAFFDFLAFFVFRVPLLFCGVCLCFSKDFRGSAKGNPCLFGGSPCFFFQKSKGWRVRVGNAVAS